MLYFLRSSTNALITLWKYEYRSVQLKFAKATNYKTFECIFYTGIHVAKYHILRKLSVGKYRPHYSMIAPTQFNIEFIPGAIVHI